jgi:putative hemolysin
LSSVQIGATLVGILTGVYSGAVFAGDLAVMLKRIPGLEPYADETAFVAVVAVATFLSLILGELVPKRVALANSEALAAAIAIPMWWVARLASPLVSLLQVSTDAVARLLPFQCAPQASVTEDEVRALVATGAKEGVFHRREQEMIEGVLRLADRPVESVMVPRRDIIWLDARVPLPELWAEARVSGHARFLLCDGKLEQLIGVITLADLGEALRVGAPSAAKYVRAPLHIPPGMSLLRLLDLFRESSVNLAIVTDEYGGVEGLVTPADILKAIAGQLADMGSRERADAVRREDGSWLIDGRLNIQDVERVLERNGMVHGDQFYTMGGFVLWQLCRVPVTGETLTWRDLRIEIADMDGARIDKVIVTKREVPRLPQATTGNWREKPEPAALPPAVNERRAPQKAGR